MGSQTFPYHPVYTSGSAVHKLSTYYAIGQLLGYIIKKVKEQIK